MSICLYACVYVDGEGGGGRGLDGGGGGGGACSNFSVIQEDIQPTENGMK